MIKDHDAEWRRIQNLYKEIAKAKISVGIHGEHNGRSQTDGGSAPLTNATLAAWHEFGTKFMPKRPFLAPLVDEENAKVIKVQKKLVEGMYSGKFSVMQALEILGQFALLDVQKRIRRRIKPPLNKQYAKAKVKAGYTTVPLIRTGEMINAITYKVQK